MVLAGAEMRAGIRYPPFLWSERSEKDTGKIRRSFRLPLLTTTMASNLLRFTAVPLTFFAAAASRTSLLRVTPGGALFGVHNVRILLIFIA